MIDGAIERRIIDGKVFVNFDDIIHMLYTVSDQALDIAEVTGDAAIVLKVKGVIEIAQGLDKQLAIIKRENGLAMYR